MACVMTHAEVEVRALGDEELWEKYCLSVTYILETARIVT